MPLRILIPRRASGVPVRACAHRASGAAARTVYAGRNHQVYAIVRSGGRQEKVAVGDLVVLDRVAGAPGSTFQLKPLMLVDGDTITTDASALAQVTVTAEVVDHRKGPKIDILKFKNKTGYRVRGGFRSQLTQVRVTGIETGT